MNIFRIYVWNMKCSNVEIKMCDLGECTLKSENIWKFKVRTIINYNSSLDGHICTMHDTHGYTACCNSRWTVDNESSEQRAYGNGYWTVECTIPYNKMFNVLSPWFMHKCEWFVHRCECWNLRVYPMSAENLCKISLECLFLTTTVEVVSSDLMLIALWEIPLKEKQCRQYWGFSKL